MKDIDYDHATKADGKLTCPQCGAPIVNDVCQYCGVYFYDVSCVDTEKPFYLKIKSKGQIHMYKVRMDEATVKYSNEDMHLWSDNVMCSYIARQDVDIDMHFHVVE